MRHLVALRIGNSYNIFYDEAQLDLETLLSGEYHPYYSDSAMAPKALVGEAWFLAGALHFLHHRLVIQRKRFLCCHLDLKPASILIVRSGDSRVGKWMLSDFGVSIIKTEARSRSLPVNMYRDEDQRAVAVTESLRYPSEYQPPESEQGLSRNAAGDDGRKADIWSFGCILTKIFVFSIGGRPLVKKFQTIKNRDNQTDLFYSTVNTGMRSVWQVKHQMKSWASQIGNQQGAWVLEWRKLIFDHMLSITAARRYEAEQVQEALDSIWKQSPAENIWSDASQNFQVRRLSPPRTDSPRRPSELSFLSSRRLSTAPPSTAGSNPATPPRRDSNVDSSMVVRHLAQGDLPRLSPRTSDSSGTPSNGSVKALPIAEIDLEGSFNEIDDGCVCSDSTRLIIWHGRNVTPYSRNDTILHPESQLFSPDTGSFADSDLEARDSDQWTDVSLSGNYIALAKSTPSCLQVSVPHGSCRLRGLLMLLPQVEVLDLDKGQSLQPRTGWPSAQGLRSVCISSIGSVALIYDKIVTFRCTGLVIV
jgi:serine/threonine protein kinase